MQTTEVIRRIPFNRASLQEGELENVVEAFKRLHISGDGFFSKKCQELFQSELSVPQALLTTSCTHALEMAALLLEIKAGDEVIVPSFTFVSTVNAFVLRGARPVFVDIRPDTLNLDEKLLEGAITSKTRAIVPVHYAGIACEMDRILELSRHRGFAVVEDNAHGLFGKYKGRYLGTMGCMGAQSFHETKNFTCGEGGALLINDVNLIKRAEIIREKGTDRSRFFRGQVDKYTWVDIGSSYLPSDILAAILLAQLQSRERIQRGRQKIWETYHSSLSSWAKRNEVIQPTVPDHCEQAFHLYYLILPSLESRQNFIAHLRKRDIGAVFHYLPLHLSTMGSNFGGKPGDCPVTEDLSDRLVRLPFYNGMTSEEQNSVIEAVQEFRV